MSATRIASIRGFSGSQSNRAGGSPVFTDRQKAYAAHLNATTAAPADAAIQQCEDTLARDVSVVHHLTFDQIRGAIAAER